MELATASDAAVVTAIARAEQGALEEAYRRHAGAVFGLARRVLGDGPMAEEVVQEAFLHLWRHPERFDPARGALRAYLLAVGHGRSVDVLRSEVARRRREERDGRLADPASGVEEEVLLEVAVREEVRAAIGALTRDERRAIVLAYFGGRTYREVAAALGEPEGTIKSRIRSGLRRMRGTLVEAGVR